MEFNIEKYHLKSTSFFDALTYEESVLVRENLVGKEYNKGEYIFREKSYSKGIYIIRKGKVKIFQTNSDGKQSIVYIYRKGDYFGYRPLVADEPHPVSAVAMETVSVLFIPKEFFINLLESSTSLTKQLFVGLSKEFSVWINKMTIFSQYTVKERVALSLLILSRIYQRGDNPRTIAISINRDDFAGFVGTAKETLVRVLRVFKDDKVITTQGTKIIILKQRALLGMVENL